MGEPGLCLDEPGLCLDEPGLCLDDIDALEEIWDGFTLMDKYGVPKENCTCLDDMKERLKLHLKQSHGQARSVEAAQDVITVIQQADETRRCELSQLYHESLVSLRGLDHLVRGHLVQEGTISDLASDLGGHVESLTSNECPILVVGETSSGKSSLLNLLLGQDILPQSLLSCTSVMCKIRYGPQLRAKVKDNNGVSREVPLDGTGNAMDQLAKYVFRKDNRDDVFVYQTVEIFVPIDFLKTGVYIIDSPGFGENPSMDSLLLDYISSNDIFAFIYVIKSDNAGGVQEDRLQRFLRFVVEQQKSRQVTSFDPHSAIFVCNRWDLVPERERAAVRADTVTKLGRCWPDLCERQVFCLSTANATLQRKTGYISEDYSRLLDGIQRLIPVGLRRKIQHSYRWLEHFLVRTLHHVTSYLAKSRISAQELEARHKMTELRLHKVDREADLIMKRLDKHLQQNVRSVARSLSDHLRSKEAYEAMMLWSMDDLPRVLDDDVWVDVESDIDVVIEKKLADCLRRWDEDNKLFQRVHTALMAAFKDEFLVLESQLSSIEHCIQSDDLSLSDKNDEDTTRFLGLAQNINTTESIFDFNFTTLQKILLGIAAPVLVPVAMGLLVGAPIFMLWDFKKWRRRSQAQRNLQTYLQDPISFLRHRSKFIADKVAELDNVTEYVTQQMEPARQVLDSMRSAVPKLVDSNRKLMDDIVNDKRTGKELEERYLEYETWIPILQEKLAKYGNMFIREYDFKADDVVMDVVEGGMFSKWHRTVGIWTDIRAGKLVHDGKKHVISVKTYRKSTSNLHLLMEETHLRRIRHPNVVSCLGTFEESRGVPGVLFDGTLVKARQELFGFRALPRASKGRNVLMERARKILEQVGMGLEYLHFRGLVHMELSLDTIMMVPKKEMVKLTNLGEPRKADFPNNLDSPTNEYCCLSPEVLRGERYKSRSDVYSLGLAAWELWNQEMAFKQQRTIPLRQFIQMVRPTLLHYDENNPFLDLITRCVCTLPDDRICSTVWVNEIRKMDLSDRDDETDEQPE